MSEKQVIARKSYWATLSPEVRSARMSLVAKAKQKKLTFKQRRDHAMRMVAARAKKRSVL
jgi:hypothetical protein